MSRPGAKFFMLRNRGIVDSADGGQIIDSTGATFNRGDFTSGNAFFWSSIDLGWYAGAYPGSTPFYIELLDAAGKKATGYIGAVGAGETLGSELITDWPFNTFDTFTSVGKDITSAIDANAALDEYTYSNLLGFSLNQLMKLVTDITLNSGTAPIIYCGNTGLNFSDRTLTDETLYFSIREVGGNKERIWVYEGVAAVCNLSCIFSIKQITDPPSTAIHIVSSLNGTTRNWASIESGFDPNTITS
jgi:hypothetical protein